ncbi:MAG: putative membrane protein [Arenicella sp.]|jgi:putative membrane protein
MYVQRRFPFKSVINWTKRELIFFTIFCSLITTAYVVFDIQWLQVPLAIVAMIGTAVAFMVGFQNNAAYDRIWEARKIWGGIVNVSRTFTITVRDSFHMHNPDNSKEEKEELKVITNRHIAWLTALRYAMRTKKSWETTYAWSNSEDKKFWYKIPELESPLEDELKGHLSEEEFEFVMKQGNKPNAIISLQSKHLRKLADGNKLWDFSLLNLQQLLQEMTALQGKSERIKNFPYPKQYGSIGYHFVHIFMWLLPFAVVPAFAKVGMDMTQTFPNIAEHFVWFNIPFTVIVIWVFNTMLRIGLAGENPFEGSPNDVPISNISRGITRDVLEIIGEHPDNIPEQFENLNDIQM